MTETLQMQSAQQILSFGDVCLAAERYALRLECPVRKQTLCSGQPLWYPIGRLPVTLTVEGRIVSSDANTLLETLRDALNRHSGFQFSFLGTVFSDMQLTKMQYQSGDNPQFTAYSLSFVGEMQTGGTA